ncbi:MAG: hypothetical protein HY063_10845 [Bacteroidetes bacterium]|nr:hypothetical protein [Bacteroidota bacterium]
MKKLMLVLAIAGFAFAANAQTTKQESTKTKSKTEKTMKYECPKCHMKSDKAGNCSASCCKEGVALVAMNDKKMEMKDHVCTSACKDGKHVYAHGEKGHVCGPECKKMMNK